MVFPQISADNATWLPFATQRIDVNLAESFYVLKVEELAPRRGLKQVTWAVRPDLVGIDPHYLRLTAIREASPTAAPATESPAAPTPTSRPVRRVLAAQASTPAIPGLVFTSQNTAAVGADLLSNTVVLRGLKGKVLVTAPAGVTLIVNGIDRGQSYSVGNGDTLALKTKAPGIADQSLELRIQVGSGSVLWTIGARRAATLAPPGGTVAGYTPVNASVGQGGDANLSIPVTVSPGIGGIEPKLSINYNSQSGNGHLGVGFSLGGMSAISRVGANEAVDGFRGSVTLASTDRFAIDDARLIATAGIDGESGTTYEKELHDFSRIRSSGRIGNGPEKWTVETKAGLKMEYGSSAISRRIWGDGSEVLIWFLSTVTDTLGNQMRFTYVQDNGDSRLTRIDYTANVNAGMSSGNSVEFLYDVRPDPSFSYFLGVEKILQHRLAAIVCKHGADIVRRYDLSYQTGEITNFSQLIAVQESSGDGTAFAPTTFSWDTAGVRGFANGITVETSAAVLGTIWNSQWEPFASSPPSRIVQGDFNGDGIMDLLHMDDYAPATHTGWQYDHWLALGKRDGGFTFSSSIPGLEQKKMTSADYSRLRTIDINGDGRSDLLHVIADASDNWVAISNGDGSFTVRDKNNIGEIGTQRMQPTFASELLTLDINGDGISDVIYLEAGKNKVYLGNKNGRFITFAVRKAGGGSLRWGMRVDANQTPIPF